MIIEYLNNIEKYPPLPQDENKVTFAYNISFDDQIIDWSLTYSKVDAHIRAMQDEPGAITYINNHILKIYVTRECDIISSAAPGTVIKLDKELVINTGFGALEILKLQPAARAMKVRDFLNGQSIINLDDKLGKEEKNE